MLSIIIMDFRRVLKSAFALHLLISLLGYSVECSRTTFVDTQHGRILGRTIHVTPWQFPASDSEAIAVEAYTKIPYAEPRMET